MLARASAAGEQPAPSVKVSQSSSADALPAGALKSSPSLYLKEAVSSAIRWQPWSPQAFALARSLSRPVLIDIGAVWCHWCHVMDETTYADHEVAAMLNANFVPVKVDSDERPDIDGYYQNAAAHLTGAGGWPLTCFTTPERRAVFRGRISAARPGSGPDGSGGENSSMLPLLRRISRSTRTIAPRWRARRTRRRQSSARYRRLQARQRPAAWTRCARESSPVWRPRTIARRVDLHRARTAILRFSRDRAGARARIFRPS